MINIENKHIYVVISQTGTVLSRALKIITGAQYNHASLSLSSDLSRMYSFGRKNPYNPFWAGFVTEAPSAGTFKRFYKTEAMVLAIEIDGEKYAQLSETLKNMLDEQDKYQYNYLGLVLAAFNIHRHKKNCYYCSEFVKEMMQRSEIEGSDDLHEIVQPIHFLNIPHKVIYTGKINEYI